jgi:hypothetical protein
MIQLPIKRGQTRALVRLHGACPSCGADVPRRVTQAAGRIEETYVCPSHGTFHYVSGARGSFGMERPSHQVEPVLAVHAMSTRAPPHGIPIIA